MNRGLVSLIGVIIFFVLGLICFVWPKDLQKYGAQPLHTTIMLRVFGMLSMVVSIIVLCLVIKGLKP